MPKRSKSNGNERGSTSDRKRRRLWLLKTFAANVVPRGGENFRPVPCCRCYRCGTPLTEKGADTIIHDDGGVTLTGKLTVDRIIPGAKGGTYARNNIRPACMDCNRDRHNEDVKVVKTRHWTGAPVED